MFAAVRHPRGCLCGWHERRVDDGRDSEKAIILPGRGSMMLGAKPTQLDLQYPDHGKTVKLGREEPPWRFWLMTHG